MKRRSVLAGLGASVAGSALLFGSGAFTQVEADRNLSIGVDEDSNALLALEPGTSVASVYADSDSGELVVDTSKLSGNDEGFGVGSTVQIGRTETDFGDEVIASLSDAAFKLTNNFDNVPGDDDNNDELDIAINLEDLDDTDSDITFVVSQYEGGGSSGDSSDADYTVSGGSQLTVNDVASGDELYFAIRIETASTSNPEDIAGDVMFRAGPNLADQFPTDATVSTNPVVNATQDESYVDIQSAVDAANAGELIQVDPSHDEGSQVRIDTDGLRIETASDSASTTSDRPTIDVPAGTDNKAVLINGASGVTLDGLQITLNGNASNSEQYGIRARIDSNSNTPDDLTVQNCVVDDIEAEDDANGTNDGAVRASGLTVESIGGTTTGLEVVNCIFDNIRTVGEIDKANHPPNKDDDSKAKGLAVNGDVNDVRIVDNTFKDIGETGGSDLDSGSGNLAPSQGGSGASGAQNVDSTNKYGTDDTSQLDVTGTEKTRGISFTEDGNPSNDPGPSDFEIVRNDFDNLKGTYGQPALFIGGTGDGFGSHTVEQNNFRHPVDNLSSDTLDLPRNWWEGGSLDPSTEDSDKDFDGGVLIDRGSGAYNVNFSRSNTISDAGSSLSN